MQLLVVVMPIFRDLFDTAELPCVPGNVELPSRAAGAAAVLRRRSPVRIVARTQVGPWHVPSQHQADGFFLARFQRERHIERAPGASPLLWRSIS